MDDDAIVAYLRECIETGNYEWDSEHLDRHMILEGFGFDDIGQAVAGGKPFEIARDRDRWLFCGFAPRMSVDPRFLGRWLHVDIQYEADASVAVVTAYRPRIALWATETRRR